MMILSTGSLSIFKNFDADIGISRFTKACSFVKKKIPRHRNYDGKHHVPTQTSRRPR
jgi:hypothetical protein